MIAFSIPILSETVKGQAWLDQFLPEDRKTAIDLLGCLELISYDAFQNDLIAELEDCLAKMEHPVSVYAVREIRSDENYFADGGPQAVNASNGVGSEGPIANLVRDLCLKFRLLDHPGIEKMRSEKVRNIIVLNDSIASGQQVRKFLEEIYKEPSVKSWVSSGKVKITAISHSAIQGGLSYILKGKVHWSVRSARMMGDLTNGLGHQRVDAMKTLCLKYGKQGGIQSNRLLGYRKTFSGVIFPHKCPNTSPGILWYDTEKWKPLFQKRASFVSPVWPTAISPEDQLRRVFVGSGQVTLAALKWLDYLGAAAPSKLALLALASRGIRYRAAMAERLGVTSLRLNELINECTNQGWFTSQGRLTKQGQAILTKAKALGIDEPKLEWSDPDAFYFL